MKNRYKDNWDETYERYLKWWNREETDRPLLGICAPNPNPRKDYTNDHAGEKIGGWWYFPAGGVQDPALIEEKYQDIEWVLDLAERDFDATAFLAESHPRMFANAGPGNLAGFLGANLLFRSDSIWFEPGFTDVHTADLQLNRNSRWWNWSIESTKTAVKRADGRFCVEVPDLVGNLDCIASLFGTSATLYNLADAPEDIHRLQKQILPALFEAYDAHYEITKMDNGWCSGSGTLGPGKVAFTQCDISAMMSPAMFDEFVMPYLIEECNWLDHTWYHLDGPGAICHLDSLLTIDSIDCIQWVPGSTAAEQDGAHPCWDFIYKKILDAGKGIIATYVDPKRVPDFVKRFGTKGVCIWTGTKTVEEANELIKALEGR